MVSNPNPGQHVRLRYAKRFAHLFPLHGAVGVVRIVGRGRGPRNHGVEIDGVIVVVPAGNLVPLSGAGEAHATPQLRPT